MIPLSPTLAHQLQCHIVNIRGSSYRMRQAHRPLQDPPLASCAVEPFTPEEKESKSKGDNDELEARHLRQVCNFRWPDLCSFRWPLTRRRGTQHTKVVYVVFIRIIPA